MISFGLISVQDCTMTFFGSLGVEKVLRKQISVVIESNNPFYTAAIITSISNCTELSVEHWWGAILSGLLHYSSHGYYWYIDLCFETHNEEYLYMGIHIS